MHFVIYRYFDSLLLYTVHLIILVAARKKHPVMKTAVSQKPLNINTVLCLAEK